MFRLVLRVPVLALALLTGPALQAQDAWSVLDAGTSNDLYAVHFVDEGTGFAAGGAGTVVRTTDGGATWTDVSAPGAPSLYGVYFFDASTGVVVGEGGTILRTVDGGASWTPVASGVVEALHTVAFEGDVGLAGGTAQTILRSTDAGATWTVVQTDFFGGGFFGADMVDADHGFVAGENSIFQPLVGYTTDAGQTFDFTAFYLDSNEGELHGIAFVDTQTGIAVGRTWDFQGAIARSTDGGLTWATTLMPEALNGVSFWNDRIGVAVGVEGTIYKTENGGVTWFANTSGTTASLHGVAVPGIGRAYAVGDLGTVLRGDLLIPMPTEPGAAPGAVSMASVGANPFHAATTLRYALPEAGPVTLRLFDALGREVAVLASGVQAAGLHTVSVDGQRLSGGVYVAVLETARGVSTRTLVRLP